MTNSKPLSAAARHARNARIDAARDADVARTVAANAAARAATCPYGRPHDAGPCSACTDS